MADQFVQVPTDSTGKKIDTSELTVGANTVERQRMVISDSVSATALATVTAGNALKVDGSGATQPVSGTVATSNLPTTVDTNSGLKSASTIRVVLATDQPALTNKLLVTPDSVALPANQSVNVAQVNGIATSTGTGVMGTGVQRIAIASDNDPLTVKQATAANLNATVVGNGTFVTQSTLAAETTKVIGTVRMLGNAGAIVDAATAAAVPANALFNGARASTANPTNATGGNMVGIMADKAGRLVVTDAQVRELIGVQQTNIAVNTEVTIVSAGGAGVFNDIAKIIITTAGLAAQTITIKDATTGTTRLVLNYPNAAVAPGTPMVLDFNPPLVQAAAAANWTATQSLATACNYTVVFVKNL